jgi:hypothetical protein
MLAPHRQALALALFETASAHDRPPRIAGKHAGTLPPGRSLSRSVTRMSRASQPTAATTHFNVREYTSTRGVCVWRANV